MFRYIRDGTYFRAWPQGFSFTIGGVTFELQEPEVNRQLIQAWPFVAWCDVEAADIERALVIGHERCAVAADVAVLISGYRIDLGIEGVRPQVGGADLPGIVQIPAAFRFRSDPATEGEQQAMLRQAVLPHFPLAQAPQPTSVLHAMRWYAESVRETDSIDRYVKLFVTLDMFVPRSRRGFADRGADVLSPQFQSVRRRYIRKCLSDLADVRNDLFHEGLADSRLAAATQILERIVRAMLRRHIALADEFPEVELFRRVGGYEVRREGGVFGWLNPSGEVSVAGAQNQLRVGDPDRKDGKHYLYAREVGAVIRMVP
ncbi:MAG: hypothetical protein WCA22_16915 [Candidatus Binatus sp.]